MSESAGFPEFPGAKADESQYYLAIPKDYTRHVDKLLMGQVEPGDFVRNKVEARRDSLYCRHHLLASRWRGGDIERFHTVDTSEPKSNGWPDERWKPLFELAFKEDDRVWVEDQPGSAETARAAAVVRVGLWGDPKEGRKEVDLMLVVWGRKDLPDSRIPQAFRSYDQFILLDTLLDIALYARHEYWERRSTFEKTRDRGRPEVRAAAKRLLDFEERLCLPIDGEVLHTWLDAERQIYVNGDETAAEFKKSSDRFGRLLAELKDPGAEPALRQLLFEGYLAFLTKQRKGPLLSQRIAEARKLAGLEGGAAK